MNHHSQPAARTAIDQALAAVSEALGAMRFGTIMLTVHEAKIVQLEVTEKHRFGQ
jgi:hypothetical protein